MLAFARLRARAFMLFESPYSTQRSRALLSYTMQCSLPMFSNYLALAPWPPTAPLLLPNYLLFASVSRLAHLKRKEEKLILQDDVVLLHNAKEY